MPRRLPLALYLGSLCILSLFLWRAGWVRTWSALQVPAMTPIFADMRVIQAATELSRQGIDPQTHSLEPISAFPMNYPSIWIGIGEVLNLPVESHFLVVCALVLCCFAGVGCFLLYRFPSYGLLACLLSTASLLGMERGNSDMVVFCLVFAFALALPRNWSLVPLLLAIALKLYPVFAIAAYLIGRRYRILMFAIAAASVVFIAYRHELAGIRAVTLQGSSFVISYGFPSLADYFTERRLSLWCFALLVGVVGAVTVILTLVLLRRPAVGAPEGRTFDLFVAGASIYVGTFILSTNWDYRLIFLILCVPFLTAGSVRFGRFVTVLIIVAMNELLLRRLGIAGVAAVWLSKIGLFVVLGSYLGLWSLRSLHWQYRALTAQWAASR